VYNIRFSRECWMNVHDLEYCWGTCYGANNCFGCVGIKKKSYCILNKQYRKEEYFDMVGRIKRHMLAAGEYGQFFPISFSPFYYNLSDANYFFPLTKDHALVQGFRWEEEKQDVIDGILSQIAIPDHIRDFSGSQINSVFLCEKTGKKYKLVKQELDFYRRENVPIPRIAPMERIKQTASILEVGQLHDSKCALCGQVFETVFGSNQVLYCEECYQKAVY